MNLNILFSNNPCDLLTQGISSLYGFTCGFIGPHDPLSSFGDPWGTIHQSWGYAFVNFGKHIVASIYSVSYMASVAVNNIQFSH